MKRQKITIISFQTLWTGGLEFCPQTNPPCPPNAGYVATDNNQAIGIAHRAPGARLASTVYDKSNNVAAHWLKDITMDDCRILSSREWFLVSHYLKLGGKESYVLTKL